MMKMRDKKSQEEMVGFVLIILLVAVIALIFLAIAIRKPAEVEVESREIGNFLQSSLYHTTSCQKSEAEFYDFQDLIKQCYRNDRCMDERDACEIMEETAVYLLDNSWNIGEESVYKGYVLNISSESKGIFYLEKGSKTGVIRGNHVLIPADEKIYMTLEVYY